MRFRFVCHIIAVCLLGGCLGGRGFTPIRYYSVDAPPSTVPRLSRSWPVSLGVRPFTAATRYRDRILYRLSEVEVGFHEYDRWVEPPAEMVTSVVEATLRAAGLFRQVVSADNVQLPAWILSGEVTRFDEVRGRERSRAECGLRVELRQAHNDQLLWSRMFTAAVPLAAETPEALAQAMRLAVQQVATHLVTGLETANLPRP